MNASKGPILSEENDIYRFSDLDRKVLKGIYQTRDTNLSKVAKRIGVSTSTAHNSLKKLKSSSFLRGVTPLIELESIDRVFTAISLINAKHSSEYGAAIGSRIAKIRGIWAVYFVIGRVDFVALIRAKNKTELENTVNELSKTPGVESSSTILALNIVREDFPESLELIISE